ncbi:MAG: thiamine phosphate synthase [Gemmatimonadales bacterium]|jgi:thiamine-phosphate pyrophosphorylase
MTTAPPRLHAVTNDAVLDLPDFPQRAQALTQAAAIAIHLRAHGWGGRRLADLARALIDRGCTVFVNDRADVACAVGAAGLHLPAAGLPVPEARRITGEHLLVGRSTHTPTEARDTAGQGADYVFLGPVWQTTSHPDRPALGLDAIASAAPARVVAIGGVTPERVADCAARGAYGVAAISALWYADDPGSVARQMELLLGG